MDGAVAQRRQTEPRARKSSGRARHKTKGKMDYTVVAITLVLLIFGLVMVYSTSYYTANQKYGNPAYWLERQGFFAACGLLLMFVVSQFDYHIWLNKSVILYFAVLASLLYVLLFGTEVNGAKRWIFIGPISVQPSEIAKLALILSFAKLLMIFAKKIAKFTQLLMVCALMLPIIGLVGIENFSTAVILLSIAAIMVFFVAPRLSTIFKIALLAVPFVVLLFSLKGYRSDRITAWLDPVNSEKGYQTLQSLYAIGSGGLTGKGLGQSLQKLGFIPEAHNDMIFSIICEELGFIGAVGVIILFLTLIFRLVHIVCNAEDLYGALIVVGVCAHIGMQVLVNVAVVTNTIPNTGVPLPFISYGGTSILFLLAEMGLVLSVARTTQREI
jgi:cell division protein FtsW